VFVPITVFRQQDQSGRVGGLRQLHVLYEQPEPEAFGEVRRDPLGERELRF